MEATNPVLSELKAAIGDYLEKYPRITLNGLSKRCTVSEPTLRRIMSNQVKTEPTVATVLEILTTISKEKNINELMKIYPGALADKLKEGYGLFDEVDVEYKVYEVLNEHLNNETSYLIYKMASSDNGIPSIKIQEMFGSMGVARMEELVSKGLIYQEGGRLHAKYKNFSLPANVFVKNFKACADFINTNENRNMRDNLFYNISNSLNDMGRKELIKLQRQTMKKMIRIMNEDRYRGELPVFFLTAIDTFEAKEDVKVMQ